MKGGALSNNKKKLASSTNAIKGAVEHQATHIRLPKGRPPTPRDIIRQAYKSAGALQFMPRERQGSTDIQRILRATKLDERIAQGQTFAEQQQLEADLTIIAAGRTAGTLPERLVAKYLLDKGYSYGGMSYQYNPNSGGFGFQVPILGGRSNMQGTGSVADIYLPAAITTSARGVLVRVNGLYWHNQASAIGADEAKRVAAIAAGYQVLDISDVEVLNKGTLDLKMRQVLR